MTLVFESIPKSLRSVPDTLYKPFWERTEWEKRRFAYHVLSRLRKQGKFPTSNPCCVCGEPGMAHHDSCDRPYEIAWLCIRHHHDRHVEIRRVEPSGKPRIIPPIIRIVVQRREAA